MGWHSLQDRACGGLRCQRDIHDMFDMLEQEKAVLEEEYSQALVLNEEL